MNLTLIHCDDISGALQRVIYMGLLKHKIYDIFRMGVCMDSSMLPGLFCDGGGTPFSGSQDDV